VSFAQNLAAVEERIDAACRRAGRDPRDVRLMGVSKFHPPAAMEAAWRSGLRLFGENRVQEAAEKLPVFRAPCPGAEVHLIGSLQRNKAKAALGLFDCIESVDRDDLIDLLGRLCAEREKPLPILLELNSGEASKAGYPDRDALFRAAEKALAYPGLSLRGLMTMAPNTEDTGIIRGAFRNLAAAQDALEKRFPQNDWAVLSMGMSGDFEIAIEEGSTLVRIGTALFGERP
jgi:pyridoxal phosphate enzyme (YggS family)